MISKRVERGAVQKTASGAECLTEAVGENSFTFRCRATLKRNSARLHVAPSFHSLQHRDLVRVFDVTANRNAHCDSGHLRTRPAKLLREINRSRLSLHSRICGQDYFVDITRFDTGDQIRNPQLLGPY